MGEVVAAIEAAAPEVAGKITWPDQPLPFPAELEHEGLEASIGPIRKTPLADGVRETVEVFSRR